MFALSVQLAPALALVEMVPGDEESDAAATRKLPSLDTATAAQFCWFATRVQGGGGCTYVGATDAVTDGDGSADGDTDGEAEAVSEALPVADAGTLADAAVVCDTDGVPVGDTFAAEDALAEGEVLGDTDSDTVALTERVGVALTEP